jgi:hypothetical protein
MVVVLVTVDNMCDLVGGQLFSNLQKISGCFRSEERVEENGSVANVDDTRIAACIPLLRGNCSIDTIR